MREFTGEVRGGKLPVNMQKAIAGYLKLLEGKRVVLSIREFRAKRSLKQNRFYFDVVIGQVVEMFRESGQVVTEEDVHDHLQREVCKWTKTVIGLDGKHYTVRRSSKEKDTAIWEQHNEIIRAWAAEYGWQIPFPNEHEFQY
jgi:very-short-patch-repair endonuclease